MSSFREDWNQRHGPDRSNGRVIVYIILLLVILLLMSRAGDFSRTFTEIFLAPSQSGETVEQ